MQIVKQGETFDLIDDNDLFRVYGNVTVCSSSIINIDINICEHSDKYLGQGRITIYTDKTEINFNLSISHEQLSSIMLYLDTLINSVKEHFKQVN